uniref:Uncharacterized protein n=1 Tax=Pithovirus LCDPAC01 TaxID=2506600 RepID=A0A481YNB6_9VIRU|nr:MAG: hypothetical protein LCDPAC01_00870 [Pithovirus LCDPAC01]
MVNFVASSLKTGIQPRLNIDLIAKEIINVANRYDYSPIMIAVYLSQTTKAGFYSMYFNFLVRSSSNIRETMEDILSENMANFIPEIYKNEYTTQNNRNDIATVIEQEVELAENAYKEGKYNYFEKECCEQLCLKEEGKSDKPSENIDVTYKEYRHEFLMTYCFDRKQILLEFAEASVKRRKAINLLNGEVFPDKVIIEFAKKHYDDIIMFMPMASETYSEMKKWYSANMNMVGSGSFRTTWKRK